MTGDKTGRAHQLTFTHYNTYCDNRRIETHQWHYESSRLNWQTTNNFSQVNNQTLKPSTDVILLTLTLKMTTVHVVETSVTVNNNSFIQDYVHPNDQTQITYEMIPGFKPFTVSPISYPLSLWKADQPTWVPVLFSFRTAAKRDPGFKRLPLQLALILSFGQVAVPFCLLGVRHLLLI